MIVDGCNLHQTCHVCIKPLTSLLDKMDSEFSTWIIFDHNSSILDIITSTAIQKRCKRVSASLEPPFAPCLGIDITVLATTAMQSRVEIIGLELYHLIVIDLIINLCIYLFIVLSILESICQSVNQNIINNNNANNNSFVYVYSFVFAIVLPATKVVQRAQT